VSRSPIPAAALAAVLALAGLAACVTPHNSLGTASSSCFQGVPVATAAVHKKGKLVGVRAVSGSTARAVLEGRTPAPDPTTTSTTTAGANPRLRGVCLFAFKGSYAAADVDHLRPGGQQRGQYAVVAVTVRTVRPIATVLADKLPVRFHHLR
jgi:hypothetical protein